jgi:hypothetical protein
VKILGFDQLCRECGRISEAKNKEGGLAAEAPVLDPERVGNEEALCAFLRLSAAAFAAVGAAAVPPGITTSADAAEPTVMSDFEADAITAAGVFVDVSSMAAAMGDVAAVGTEADTVAIGTEHMAMGIGTTVGEALACCGENAEVEVGRPCSVAATSYMASRTR